MTSVVTCVQRGGKIVPLDQKKLDKWKKHHKEGEAYEMILDDGSSSALSPMGKKFHALRDEYAEINGYTNDAAKVELKYLHGVWTQPDDIPLGRDGRTLRYHGEVLWFLSIRDYTPEELQRLVAGSEMVIAEVSV